MNSTTKVISPFLIVYYLVLLVVVFLLMRPDVVLPLLIRVALLVSLFMPVINNPRILPAVVLLFMGIDASSFTQVLPSDKLYILLGVSGVYFFLFRQSSKFFVGWLLIFAYFFFSALFRYDVEKNILWLFIAIMLGDMIRDTRDLQLLFCSFMLLSIFLGLLFLVHQQEFATQYGHLEDDLERSFWINPNVFGGAIAAGGVLSLSYLTGILKLNKSKVIVFISIVTAVITFFVLVLNASRGSFLAFALPSVLMVIVNKSTWYVKILIPLAVGIMIYVLLMYMTCHPERSEGSISICFCLTTKKN